MARTHAVSGLRRPVGRISLVRGAPFVWKRWRIHRSLVVLLLSWNHPRNFTLGVYAARDRRSLGDLRHDLHRNRSCAHFVRSPRGRALELAENPAIRSFALSCDRLTIFAARNYSDGARADVLRRTNATTSGNRHLGISMWYRPHIVVCRLRFPFRSFSPEPAPCQFLRWNMAVVHHAWGIRSAGFATSAE